jgi:hypothetical protein
LEAQYILHSKVQALRLRPIKIISTPDVIKTDEFHSHLVCPSNAADGANRNIRCFVWENHRYVYYHYRSQQLVPMHSPDASRKIKISMVVNEPPGRFLDWTWDLSYDYTALRRRR